MVLSVITLAVTAPLLATSTMQLSDQAQKRSDQGQQELKRQKCHLAVRASPRMSTNRREELANKVVVVRDGRLLLSDPKQATDHPFTGYFLPFPETQYDGLVTTINNDNFLNWVYIDTTTFQLKHGTRADAQPQLTGPMDLKLCKNGERRLTFRDWEGFVAVEESPDRWALYFDVHDDGLEDKRLGKYVVEVELIRKDLDDDHHPHSS
ncbi:hypothetical protein PV08_00171 [Exophiala spinifera]|uniref:Uncharacterized protein n=1 Tax=Exophiala spinifera TaxID=91928 RepID=A0A0D2BKX8_9EURO|nr:uncharacterized protein PV08_00171 [Exophiala spinifera]KIW19598.1 hypothetical protein PV08_00171 [Exophiala spinifera]